MRTIYQFMWGYQHHFRLSLEHTAQYALKRIGVDLKPVAMLVGFRATEESQRLPICVEPETGDVQPEHLTTVVADGQANYVASQEFRMFHSDPQLNEIRHAGYRDRSRADALGAALSMAPGGSDRVFFVGYSQRIEEHEVHPVLSVDKKEFESLPRLTTSTHTNMPMTVSLPFGVIQNVLRLATRCMASGEAPQGISSLSDASDRDAVLAAARSLVYSVATMTGNFLAHSLYDALGELVTMPYEGRAGAGGICLVDRRHANISTVVSLQTPVNITAERQFRKLLEITAPGLDLLCDGEEVYALGRLKEGYDQTSENAFRIAVVARGAWELEHSGVGLMRVEHGKPVVPRPRISEERFVDTVRRVFATISQDDAARLWKVALIASKAAHGTMLVITESAEEEVARLAPQAVAIVPQVLEPEVFHSLTAIDGSLLLAPDGTCHAVGVILDGYAAGVGDAGRGARYNSAIRYSRTTSLPCVIVIVSEDGMIDIEPELAPRVAAAAVEEAVRDFEAAVDGEPLNFEAISKARREVERLSFYLDAGQVERSNLATERAEDLRQQSSGMRIHLAAFELDPRMNDDYFTD
ncbi:DNA integrity scanning protein DisA nucleotide-binding domain protein [Kribbella sp. NPDC051620]|uniref:DNA integrity scanning protein DisA nucleotide-binding domain protein n=1 Tax=Kribbella sp. NPDC051620 TaxID=3364120 RepID=UPI00378CBFDA